MPRSFARLRAPLVLLIGGTPRSGTTAITDVLNLNADVALLSEYPLADFVEHLAPLFAFEEGLARFDAFHGGAGQEDMAPTYPAMRNPGPDPRRHPRRADLGHIAAQTLAASLAKNSPRVIGAKSPLYLLDRRHDNLGAIFGDVRHLLMLRHPIDQINSSLNRRNRSRNGIDDWHVLDIATAVREYRQLLQASIAAGLRWPKQVLFVKFEDLADDQAAVLERVHAFLGLPPSSYPNVITRNRQARNILTSDERDYVQAMLGDVIEVWDNLDFTGPAHETVDRLISLLEPAPPYRLPAGFDTFKPHLGWGWSDAEADGVWSDGREATLVFGPSAPVPHSISFEITPFIPRARGAIEATISLNGTPLFHGEWRAESHGNNALDSMNFPNGFHPHTILLDNPRFNRSGANVLRVAFDAPSTPLLEGINEDRRRLGMKLHRLGFGLGPNHAPNVTVIGAEHAAPAIARLN